MKNFSILMLGGGKRVSLAEHFIASGKDLNLQVSVYSYDLVAEQPISLVGEVFTGKSWDDPCLIDDLMELVKAEDFNLIIANVDPATKILAQLQQVFPDKIISSDYRTTNICFSKVLFNEFGALHGLPVIPLSTYGKFPYFVKPIFGSASKDARVINSLAEESQVIDRDDFIIQEFIDGVEFTVDAYVRGDGDVFGISPRVRITTSGGESVESEIVDDSEILDLARLTLGSMNLKGPVTVQFIRRKIDGRLFLLEVNPRFGGGVPLSLAAGCKFTTAMIGEFAGIEVEKPRNIKHLLMKRYFKEAYFEIDN
jgi:carbamoyl-phosphate synthase large subunit